MRKRLSALLLAGLATTSAHAAGMLTIAGMDSCPVCITLKKENNWFSCKVPTGEIWKFPSERVIYAKWDTRSPAIYPELVVVHINSQKITCNSIKMKKGWIECLAHKSKYLINKYYIDYLELVK